MKASKQWELFARLLEMRAREIQRLADLDGNKSSLHAIAISLMGGSAVATRVAVEVALEELAETAAAADGKAS